MTTSQRYSHGIFRDTRLMNTSCNYYRFDTNMEPTNRDHDNFKYIFTWKDHRYQAHEPFMQLS